MENQDTLASRFTEWVTDTFYPLLAPVFQPVDELLAPIYMPWARIAAIALFVLAIVWVFNLRKEYVNLDAPGKQWYYDLRIWTIVSMLPHFIVYLYF